MEPEESHLLKAIPSISVPLRWLNLNRVIFVYGNPGSITCIVNAKQLISLEQENNILTLIG